MGSWTSWCPPMFEDSPKRNTKRLFLCASDQIAEQLRRKHNVDGYLALHYSYLAHMAWLVGASTSAQALVREIDVIQSAWGKGSEQGTLSLIKVCVAHTMSIWVGEIDSPQSLQGGEGIGVEYARAASSILGVINEIMVGMTSKADSLTAQDVRDGVKLDIQWRSEREGEKKPLVYACLVMSKAMEACGQRPIQWEKLSFPVTSIQAFLDMEALLEIDLGDSQRLLRVLDCLAEGVASMKRFQRMNMEGKVQPSGRS